MTQLEEIDRELTDSKFYELCNIMGKKWVLLILISIYSNIHTFSGIMKAIPNKLLQPQFKKYTTPQEDISKNEIIDINEGENLEANKKLESFCLLPYQPKDSAKKTKTG